MRATVVTFSLVAGLAVPALAAPAQAATSFPRKAVQQAIEKQIVEVIGQKADVRCPTRKKWVKGAVFYCKAKPTNGAAAYRVRVKLGSAKTYAFDWRQSA